MTSLPAQAQHSRGLAARDFSWWSKVFFIGRWSNMFLVGWWWAGPVGCGLGWGQEAGLEARAEHRDWLHCGDVAKHWH